MPKSKNRRKAGGKAAPRSIRKKTSYADCSFAKRLAGYLQQLDPAYEESVAARQAYDAPVRDAAIATFTSDDDGWYMLDIFLGTAEQTPAGWSKVSRDLIISEFLHPIEADRGLGFAGHAPTSAHAESALQQLLALQFLVLEGELLAIHPRFTPGSLGPDWQTEYRNRLLALPVDSTDRQE